MAATPLFDLNQLDLNRVAVDREGIYSRLPHRHEFMQLDAIVHLDSKAGVAVGLRHIRNDEFWVRGHIPGQPIMPGVLMLETAAQMAAYLSQEVQPSDKFLAFGGLEDVRFRTAVFPPAKMYIIDDADIAEIIRKIVVTCEKGYCDGKDVMIGRDGSIHVDDRSDEERLKALQRKVDDKHAKELQEAGVKARPGKSS